MAWRRKRGQVANRYVYRGGAERSAKRNMPSFVRWIVFDVLLAAVPFGFGILFLVLQGEEVDLLRFASDRPELVLFFCIVVLLSNLRGFAAVGMPAIRHAWGGFFAGLTAILLSAAVLLFTITFVDSWTARQTFVPETVGLLAVGLAGFSVVYAGAIEFTHLRR